MAKPIKSSATAGRRVLLGEFLVEQGLISVAQLDDTLKEQVKTGEQLGAILVRRGLVTEQGLMALLSEQLNLPHVALAEIKVQTAAIQKVPAAIATRYQLMPIALDGNRLRVATADPLNVQVLDELKLLLGCEIAPVLSSVREIQQAIQRYYGIGASAVEQLLDTGLHEAAPISFAEDLTARPDEASVISFVNQLILSAVKERATDLHVEPFDQLLRIRQRIDGVMYEMSVPQDLVKLHQAIVSRIKVMAQLDIAERRLPQDGRIKVRMENQELDLRISVLPSSYGESVVIRVLSSNMLFSLEQLGLSHDHLVILQGLIQKPHGIIFVTGPTGSGKTTTLYACLAKLNAPTLKILTIEDPIEYQLQGITQLQVHPKIGFSFAAGLRSMLRHDPDIMMVGEVRDPETAEITIRSALTGHLVFSTLHTNDAAGGITRLLDMGVEPFLVASSVLCFIAQRLVRVVCPGCAEERPAPDGLRAQFGVQGDLPKALRYGRGCPACKGTGYKGRTAIYEFLTVTDAIQQLILAHASSHDIARAAISAGQMRTLRQDGWQKIVKGQTTPEEVLRVT
ncbi:MAG: Flp pilus assembly complex ATPase component TadA [Candidatus Omnitrophica bacterium]|nr:Flp pilus assembly complex ATPase component TadA [Candidatus Omnitrophota bacterium]